MKKLVLSITLLTLALGSTLWAAGEGWIDNFAAAKEQAAKEGKDILIDFSGSDWCGWCIKLDEEVFQQQVFKQSAPNDFILLLLDFPRDKSKVSEATTKQNAELQKEFGVRGFPTLFLTDAKGRPYAKLGYQAGGAENYLKYLATHKAIGKQRNEFMAQAAKAEGLEQAKLQDKALSVLDSSLLTKFYGDVMDDIIKLDKENKAGLKLKYERIIFDDNFNALLGQGKFDQAMEELEKVCKGWNLTEEEAAKIKIDYEEKAFDSRRSSLLRQQKYDEIIELQQAMIKKLNLQGEKLASAELQIADTYSLKGETAKAMEMVAAIIEKHQLKEDKLQNALLIRYNTYQRNNETEKAMEALKQAMDAAPETDLGKNIKRFFDQQEK